MEITRRTLLGAAGAMAASAATPRPAKTAAGKSEPKCYVAVVTPCDSKGRFDDSLYADVMGRLRANGADGVLVLGTTGEFPSFSVAERKKIAETALKHRAGMEIIVQIGTPNLPETLDLLHHAVSNGTDAVLCMPPFYFKHVSVQGLTDYLSQVLEASKVPVYLYHYPGMSEVPISAELLHHLEKYPNLAGIKDSTGNAESYQILCQEFPKLNMMSGTENNVPIALEHGNGAILVSANLFTKQVAAVFQAKRAGKDLAEPLAKMREAQQTLRAPGVPGGAAQIKYAFTAFGMRESFVRPPQVNLTADQKAALKPKLADLAKLA